MKAKYLIGAFLMALLGGAVTLFAYTKIIDKRLGQSVKDTSQVEIKDGKAILTALAMQEGQVDFTYAAEMTVHAVVHVRTKTTVGAQGKQPDYGMVLWRQLLKAKGSQWIRIRRDYLGRRIYYYK